MGISLLCVMGLSLPALGGNMPAAREHNKLQGEWMLAETADEHRADRGDDNLRMEITGRVVVLKFHGNQTNRGTCTAFPSDGFPAVDLRLGKGQPIPGIYALEGDVLIFCYDVPGKPRPQNLTPTGTQWRETWRRLRP
jgi:uncharacterized protein (TIGR03067 family)